MNVLSLSVLLHQMHITVLHCTPLKAFSGKAMRNSRQVVCSYRTGIFHSIFTVRELVVSGFVVVIKLQYRSAQVASIGLLNSGTLNCRCWSLH